MQTSKSGPAPALNSLYDSLPFYSSFNTTALYTKHIRSNLSRLAAAHVCCYIKCSDGNVHWWCIDKNIVPFVQLSRIDKFPLGSLLVFWPAAWSLTMSARRMDLDPYLYTFYMLSFLVGSTVLHSAACTINDICDREFDAQVARCKSRPLPSGRATIHGALLWTLVQTLCALSLLGLANSRAWRVGLYGVFPLHALYPLMKRWTNWPQAWLGLAMNWGVPVAWLTVSSTMFSREVPILLFCGALAWTMIYDTIYACQDRKDDVKAGVKSTAVLFGKRVKEILTLLASIFIVALYFAGIRNEQGKYYFLVSVGGSTIHCIWQLITLNADDNIDCLNKFIANHNLGYIIWVGQLLDYASAGSSKNPILSYYA